MGLGWRARDRIRDMSDPTPDIESSLPPLPAISSEFDPPELPRQRVEPRLIRILPQPSQPNEVFAMSILPGFVLVLMGVALVFLDQPHAGTTGPSKITTAAWYMGIAGLILATVIGIPFFLLNETKAKFVAHCREQQQSGTFRGEVLARKQRSGPFRTNEEQVREIGLEYVTGRHPRAWILCVGAVEVPEIDPNPFEPEIIPASRYLWDLGAMVTAAAMVVLLVLWMTPLSSTLGLPFGQQPAILLLLAVIGGPLLIRWFWLTFVRPRYLRLAPGMIQVLTYKWGRGRPQINSFPIEGGTLVVLTNQLKSDLTLSVMRDGLTQSIPVAGFRDSARTRSLIWRVLLTRVPTPPLSEEGLVG